jgi:uncharacterized protein with GYD domain
MRPTPDQLFDLTPDRRHDSFVRMRQSCYATTSNGFGHYGQRERHMSMYLVRFNLTPAAWSHLIENLEDRREVLTPIFAGIGGTLHGYWYAFGDHDVYLLAELPSDAVAVGAIAKVAASGSFGSVATTKLFTVDEMLDALRGVSGVEYVGPGTAS